MPPSTPTASRRLQFFLGTLIGISLVVYVEISFAPRSIDLTTSFRHIPTWVHGPPPPWSRTDKFIPDPHVGLDAGQIARQDAVKRAMQHAWSGYESRAFGADEVAPVSGQRRHNVWGGIGVTLVDSLDTLYIMGMRDEFHRARNWVANHMNFTHLGADGTKISVFEIVIRQLGGLLSAYDLSRDAMFKQRAVELADRLLPAFKHGVFYTHFNVFTNETYLPLHMGLLADFGTLQLEMRYLSDITDNALYREMGDAFYTAVRREGSFENTGLFPVEYEPETGHFATEDTIITIGARGDSFYEYLLKVWLYSGKRTDDLFLRQLYDDAVAGMETHLLVYSTIDDVYYLKELQLPEMYSKPRQDHLLCFVPGMLALGTVGESNATKVTKHLALAKKLMHTCVSYYTRQPTGLAPDLVGFPGFDVLNSVYILRPETVESLMYMYRITNDPIYREWGWTIFEAIEKHAKTTFGYGAVWNVHNLTDAFIEDKMESFFLAETLKYHYLLQSAPSFVPLDQYVFNTEAHPLRMNRQD
ncbi:hypothetical protein H257_07994 [Aphanomyces astaci]|uniref:alpha-1,2-Mannosidase n=2 Tax=Aphanomyces astaci TaxID=112090 RepID=W4GGS3_APHAT|nr:hypothetical protein H257_07994 [Aphanomyces astaci]ETV78471.1 hypothetical protein H257_07994 [Aphanomyces astaci]|eukprot:XP_009832052.1 hypothetical protein H257_07994 [Aphanomyces astaci]